MSWANALCCLTLEAVKARGVRAIVVYVDDGGYRCEVIEYLTLLGLELAASDFAGVPGHADAVDIRLVRLDVGSCEGEGG
jgi:hypothetical protein